MQWTSAPNIGEAPLPQRARGYWKTRFSALHEELERLLEALAQPHTATEVFGLLFRRPIASGMLQMATGESVAHLNCLIQRGQVMLRMDDAGVAWYQATND